MSHDRPPDATVPAQNVPWPIAAVEATALSDSDRARARLAAIVESSDDAIISKDLNGIITTWNRSAERIFGYTSAEAIGRSITMLLPAERLSEEAGILDQVRRGERIDHYETVRQRQDGTLIDVSLTVSPILDDLGNVIGASKIARDITERKQSEARAMLNQEATARFFEIGKRCVRPGEHLVENLLEILDAAMWISGADKGIVQLYDEATETLRLAVERGFDQPFLESFATVERGDDSSACVTSLNTGERVIVEDVTNSAIFAGRLSLQVLVDAGVRAVQSTPLASSKGTVLGIVSTHFNRPHRPSEAECRLLDVLARQAADYVERKRGEEQREELLRTAQRAREEAELANRAKDEFLAMLGHELRNPLAAVRNAVAAAALDEVNRDRALEIARRQTDQLGRIVDDLLDVARITHGRVRLRKEQISVTDVLQRAVDGARALMDERGHTLALSAPPEAIHVEADAARIEQAVANLLTNAAKYTEPGGRVTVTAERINEHAVIRVSDNGIGIAPEILPRVFDLFTQGERSLDRTQGGLGIGLTLVRRIVELHGGAVDVHSQGMGSGTEFIIRLPALPPALATSPARLHEAEPDDLDPQHRRVLIVEDHPDSAETLMMILELIGHQVRVAHDGIAALRAAQAIAPEIMIIDIGLPGMNGYEVAQAIRRDPALKHLVLIALTGYGLAEDKARAIAAGFDHHLVKPVDLNTLRDLMAGLRVPARASGPGPIGSHA